MIPNEVAIVPKLLQTKYSFFVNICIKYLFWWRGVFWEVVCFCVFLKSLSPKIVGTMQGMQSRDSKLETRDKGSTQVRKKNEQNEEKRKKQTKQRQKLQTNATNKGFKKRNQEKQTMKEDEMNEKCYRTSISETGMHASFCLSICLLQCQLPDHSATRCPRSWTHPPTSPPTAGPTSSCPARSTTWVPNRSVK